MEWSVGYDIRRMSAAGMATVSAGTVLFVPDPLESLFFSAFVIFDYGSDRVIVVTAAIFYKILAMFCNGRAASSMI